MKLSEEAKEFLKRNYIKNYTINSDGLIDVTGNVNIKTIQSKFPVKFGKVTGNFSCYYTQLASLEGAPSCVGGYFYAQDNKLTSLEGAPSHVGYNFYCNYNDLTSLHGIHKIIKVINGGYFYCASNEINDSVLGLLLIDDIRYIELDNIEVQKILNRHINQGRAGVIGAQQELFDAGLDEYARL